MFADHAMRRCWLLLLLLPLLAAGQERLLDIKPRITCHSPQLLLEDVVVQPELLTAEERGLVLASIAEWEPICRITLRFLATLCQRHPELHDLSLRGASWITVSRAASPELMARARASIVAALEERPPWAGWSIDVRFTDEDALRMAALTDYRSVEVQSIDPRDALGTVPLRVIFHTMDDKVQDLRLAPGILRQVDVVMTTRSLPRGHILAESDLTVSRLWIGRERLLSVTDVATCIGQELGRRLGEGDMVEPADLLRPMCAERDDEVWVTSQIGALSVRMRAVAVQRGREGDRVLLRNPQSGKQFHATLTAPRQAILNSPTF